MRKASYTDRKLTPEEQVIAEKYFGLVKVFLNKKYYIYYDQMIDDMNLVLLDVKSGIPETYRYVTEHIFRP